MAPCTAPPVEGAAGVRTVTVTELPGSYATCDGLVIDNTDE
jgi:hypothetical protein